MNLNVLWVLHTITYFSFQNLISKKQQFYRIYILWHVHYHPCFINKDQRSCVSCPGSHS